MFNMELSVMTLLAGLLPALSGDKLPKGPPWHAEYRSAKREALRYGRPVFVYFTKTY